MLTKSIFSRLSFLFAKSVFLDDNFALFAGEAVIGQIPCECRTRAQKAVVADGKRRNEVAVTAQKAVVADRRAVLTLAVEVGKDDSTPDVTFVSDSRVSDVRQMRGFDKVAERGVFDFHKVANAAIFTHADLFAQMSHSTNGGVFADFGRINLAFCDNNVFSDGRIRNLGAFDRAFLTDYRARHDRVYYRRSDNGRTVELRSLYVGRFGDFCVRYNRVSYFCFDNVRTRDFAVFRPYAYKKRIDCIRIDNYRISPDKALEKSGIADDCAERDNRIADDFCTGLYFKVDSIAMAHNYSHKPSVGNERP